MQKQFKIKQATAEGYLLIGKSKYYGYDIGNLKRLFKLNSEESKIIRGI